MNNLYSPQKIVGNNDILSNIIKILIDCSNNFTISIWTDSSGITFANDNMGNNICEKKISSLNLERSRGCDGLKRAVVYGTLVKYSITESIKITFDDNHFIHLFNNDNYWYNIIAIRSILDNYDLLQCSPITIINNHKIVDEITTFLQNSEDVSQQILIKTVTTETDSGSVSSSSSFSNINQSPIMTINIYSDSSGTIYVSDNNNLPIKNRYLSNITYSYVIPQEHNDGLESLQITFGNNSTYTAINNINLEQVNSDVISQRNWYDICIYNRKIFDLIATVIPLPLPLISSKDTDNEKLTKILNSLISCNNIIFFTAYQETSGNNFINRGCDGTERVVWSDPKPKAPVVSVAKSEGTPETTVEGVVYGTLVEYSDNENEFVKNRRITQAFYTQPFIDNKTKENIPGYITITFNNYSTFTAIDNIDCYFYNIKIK